MPFFSVVIPLYNKETFVAKTLESVLAQTFADYEIVIVDDCSTDNSRAVAERFAGNVRIISHETNKGLSAARNTGIANANADYVAFLDADDVWKPFFLEKMHDLIGRFPQAGIFAAAYEELHPGNVTLETHKNLALAAGEMALIENFFAADIGQPIFCYSAAVVGKTVFETVGGFDPKINFGEDTDFNIRANLRFRLAYCNTVCASYVIFSENQITTNSIANKTVTDFNKYEPEAAQNASLKKYLDLNRYFLALHFRLSGNREKFSQLAREIDRKNLTRRQRLLLDAPLWLLKSFRKIKRIFLKKGIRLTTFRN